MTENPKEAVTTPRKQARKLFGPGVLVTTIYVGGMLIYAWWVSQAMLAMKPDQFATFLAGIFAPLAFLWLVLGFIQQGEELRNSAEALRLQEEELHNLVEQQADLVKVSREQFKHQQDRADAAEKEARRLAQPTLVLRGGTAFSSAGAPHFIERSFELGNVGPTCTNLRINFGNLKKSDYLASFANGDKRVWKLPFDLSVFEEAEIFVSYLDARGEPGEKRFRLKKRGHKVSVALDAKTSDNAEG